MTVSTGQMAHQSSGHHQATAAAVNTLDHLQSFTPIQLAKPSAGVAVDVEKMSSGQTGPQRTFSKAQAQVLAQANQILALQAEISQLKSQPSELACLLMSGAEQTQTLDFDTLQQKACLAAPEDATAVVWHCGPFHLLNLKVTFCFTPVTFSLSPPFLSLFFFLPPFLHFFISFVVNTWKFSLHLPSLMPGRPTNVSYFFGMAIVLSQSLCGDCSIDSGIGYGPERQGSTHQ